LNVEFVSEETREEFLNEEIFDNLAPARRLLATATRPGLADAPAARPLAPSPTPCYHP
jgi:hypothetical protein